MSSDGDSDEEFYDCVSDVKYCAIASPQGEGCGQVFSDFKKAQEKWKQVKGARMKVFDDYACAQEFASTPIKCKSEQSAHPPSPKADVECTPYSSVPQSTLLKFRSLIEKGDIIGMRQMVDENPMTLVTSSDTPTLIQVRLRYNALHVASAAGVSDAVDFLLSRLNSATFWRQIYPGTDDHTAFERQRHVTDLYLNSPELGSLETPLHFACKFGHLNCARLLICHPLAQLDLRNRSGQTPAECICSRVSSHTQSNDVGLPVPNTKLVVLTQSIRRLFDEFFIVLADVESCSSMNTKVIILPPCHLQRLQTLLAHAWDHLYPGFAPIIPYFLATLNSNPCSEVKADPADDSRRVPINLSDLGLHDQFSMVRIRGIAGPMQRNEAESFRSKWLKANSVIKHGAFASIRLTDPDKGYERQGRYFSKLFGTQWFEYWNFLDDFVDLSSEQGLELLEHYLNSDNTILRPPQLIARNGRQRQSVEGSHTRNKLSKIYTSSNSNAMSATDIPPAPPLNEASAGPHTPLARAKRALAPDLSTIDPWYSYRSDSSAVNLLNDSLDGSSNSSELQFSAQKSDSSPEAKQPLFSNRNSFSPLSPVVGLLEKLTFRSPLRWLLISPPGCGEPLLRVPNSDACSPTFPIPSCTKSTAPIETTRSKKVGPKRRMSAVKMSDSTINKVDQDQPVIKKPSPLKQPVGTEHGPVKLPLPALCRHVYRALPGGDPELETAIAVMACADKETKTQTGSSSSDRLAPRWFRSTSLSKFQSVSNWKRLIEECDAQLYHSISG